MTEAFCTPSIYQCSRCTYKITYIGKVSKEIEKEAQGLIQMHNEECHLNIINNMTNPLEKHIADSLETTAGDIFKKIYSNLSDRKGIKDNWGRALDEDIQEEIKSQFLDIFKTEINQSFLQLLSIARGEVEKLETLTKVVPSIHSGETTKTDYLNRQDVLDTLTITEK